MVERKDTVHPVLMIDDDEGLCALLCDFFAAHGIVLRSAHDGRTGLARALENAYHLILLDVMLPERNGLDVLKYIRVKSSVPVILLTARTAPLDRIEGLNAGADDYIPKPFEADELLARVRAVLRRTGKTAPEDSVIAAGDVRLDLKSRQAWRQGVRLRLTSTEFDILDLLLRNAGHVVSRNDLTSLLYFRDAIPSERWIDVHVCHLRKKLQADDGSLIQNVRGVGYQWVSV